MSKMIFVNLPATDLEASVRFYEAIGFGVNDQYSDSDSMSMVWADNITIQLHSREHFATFTRKQVAEAHATCEVMLGLPCDSRDELDGMVAAAATAGGTADVREPQDMGWLYTRAVADPDGHHLEVLWMDPSAMGG